MNQIFGALLCIAILCGSFTENGLSELSDHSLFCTISQYTDAHKELTLPDDINGAPLTTIGERSFLENENILSVVLPETIDTIDSYAFAWSSLRTISFMNEHYHLIDDGAFESSRLESAVLPKQVNLFGRGVFGGCWKLTDVVLPETIHSIPPYTFIECESLRTIVLPDSVFTVDECAFYGCTGLRDIQWPEALNMIDKEAFEACAFEKLFLPGQLAFILDSAFSDCKALTYAVLPRSLQYIADTAFFGCGNLVLGVYPDTVGYQFAVSHDFEYILLEESR